MESNEGADVPLESSWLDRDDRWEWQLMHVVHKEEMHTLSVEGALGGAAGWGWFADLHKATAAVAPLDIFHIYTLCETHSAAEHLTWLYVTRRSRIISTLAADKVELVATSEPQQTFVLMGLSDCVLTLVPLL